MDITIKPGLLKGEIPAPESKSHAHRLMIAAALAGADGRSFGVSIGEKSEDLQATERCLEALLGEGASGAIDLPRLYCGESGSTLRFLLPLSVCYGRGAVFYGGGKLPERPLAPLDAEMIRHGVRFERDQQDPHEICRTSLEEGLTEMKGGEFRLPGNVSSQYVTGLLLALPLIKEDSKIILTSKLQSRAYVDITLKVLEDFGIDVKVAGEKDMPVYEIKGGQKYILPGEVNPEGDWSNAAFWLVAGALGSDISVTGLRSDSPQGDKNITELIELFKSEANSTRIIDVSEVPDLVPILCVLASLTPGDTEITGGERLRIKESDRIKTTVDMLSALGAEIEERAAGMFIRGKDSLEGGTVDGAGDHRIVMAAAIAATRCDDEVTIIGAEAVNKSYPSFFEKYEQLGGSREV
ncbi:MAG: 3-phosphoshikimate 1-carboxyvinyltransferase [Firmicutes bacterium]|nr:3-phosphoshikimate 1-carboxyvinyltransferase [Bacillota bacterium]